MGLPRRWKLVVTHVVLVSGLLLVVPLSALPADDQERNVVGAGAVLALIGLGLPWTVPATAAPHLHDMHSILFALVMLGPAVLNVAIGASIAYGLGSMRRRARQRA